VRGEIVKQDLLQLGLVEHVAAVTPTGPAPTMTTGMSVVMMAP